MHDPLSNLLPEFMHFNSLQATQIVLLMGIVMFFGALGGRLFQKLKIPQVVGYIVIGIIIGVLGAFLVCMVIGFAPHVSVGTVLGATFFSSAVGIFFGIYPAKKAAKLSPIEALRHE